MHGQKLFSAQLLAFPGQRRLQLRPMTIGNTAALPPFLGPLGGDSDISGHLRDGLPAAEHLIEGFHNPLYIGDQLSHKGVAIVPVTNLRSRRTISGMGRARTPVQFNKELAMRLKAARIAAGYDTMKPFATAIGIELERYKKWESGRTPFQHEYLQAICEITGKDANYFYGMHSAGQQVRRTGT